MAEKKKYLKWLGFGRRIAFETVWETTGAVQPVEAEAAKILLAHPGQFEAVPAPKATAATESEA